MLLKNDSRSYMLAIIILLSILYIQIFYNVDDRT